MPSPRGDSGTASWGHFAKSLVIQPASTTHSQLSDEDLRKGGVLPELVRLSIGLEHIDDITAELDRALEAVGPFNR